MKNIHEDTKENIPIKKLYNWCVCVCDSSALVLTYKDVREYTLVVNLISLMYVIRVSPSISTSGAWGENYRYCFSCSKWCGQWRIPPPPTRETPGNKQYTCNTDLKQHLKIH